MKQFATKGDITADYEEIGNVQVSGKATLTEVEEALAAKAAEKGGDAYFITAAGGDNKMFGNAVVYKQK